MKLTEKLAVLQNLSEAELRRSVLIDLFDAMGYVHIEDLHGPLEDGKDLVFRRRTPILDDEYTAVVIKAHKITGNIEDSKGARTVFFQTEAAITKPHRDSSTGDKVTIAQCFIVTPYELDSYAKRSVARKIGVLASRVIRFIDGPKLIELIDEYLSDRFLGALHNQSEYFRTLYRHNHLVKNLKDLGAAQDRKVYDIYTGGALVDFFPHFRKPPPKGQRYEILDLIEEDNVLIIYGGPGGGKSLSLQKLILDLMEAEDRGPQSTGGGAPSVLPAVFSEA